MLIYILTATFLVLVTADFYSSKYDEFDVQPLIDNDRILINYLKCFLDQGPCTPDARDFKKVIPETMETSCGKCTYKQKQLIRKVIKAVVDRHPDGWEQLMDKYDTDNKHRESFNQFIHGND